jgi:hypothetical protein
LTTKNINEYAENFVLFFQDIQKKDIKREEEINNQIYITKDELKTFKF